MLTYRVLVTHVASPFIYFVCSSHDTILQYLGPLHIRDRVPVTITLQALSLVEKAEPVQALFTLCLTDQRSMWMQDGCNVYMDSYMASNGSCFMVTWTIFKNRLLQVGRPNTKPGDHGTPNAHNLDILYFIMREDLHEHKFTEIAFGWGSGHIWLHTTLEGQWPHHMLLEVCWDGLWTLTSSWALTISWSRLLARVWSDP